MENIGNKDFKMKTSFIKLEEALHKRLGNALYNTSYPLSPEDWNRYSTSGNLKMDSSQPMAFYIHIPFCKSKCDFCEYTTFSFSDFEEQRTYLDKLKDDINAFLTLHKDITLYGFDIGGGTPTSLEHDNFKALMNLYENIIDRVKTMPDFEPSIEASFESLRIRISNSIDEWKIKDIYNAGIRRVSLGMRSTIITSYKPMSPLHTLCKEIEERRDILNCLKNNGIEKINLDLMYGMKGQNIDTINQDLDVLAILYPEQVTLYEWRRNQIRKCSEREGFIIPDYHENNFKQYETLYRGLINLGYHAPFGQNTFSRRTTADNGMSSYLRHRMFDGWQYKRFGISAQSMSTNGISYNIGKNSREWKIRPFLESESFEAQMHYSLPKSELLSKFIAISGYSGSISLQAARKIYGNEFDIDYKDILDFMTEYGFATVTEEKLRFTLDGFKFYGPLLSLFHTSRDSN